MPTARSLAASDEIRAYLIDELNLVLRRPGMFGKESELALRMLMDHLLFVECQPEALADQQCVWEERGAWSSTGVAGVFGQGLRFATH